jgi:CDP-paratose synthetase
MDNDAMTILMTGATGYLGSNILRQLVKDGKHKVIVLKRSFSNTFRINGDQEKIIFYNIDEINIEKIFIDNKIDLILHCATDYGRKSINPLQIIEANLILPVKLLEFGRKHETRCFINTDTILDKRINHYSLSKKQFRDWLWSYKSDMVCINVELEHFYGSGDDKTKFVSHIVDSMIRNVEEINLTLGEQKRNFVYIDDVVGAFMTIINKVNCSRKEFYEYQIGSDEAVSIREFVLLIKEVVGNDKTVLNFGALPYRENEVMECAVDVSKIKELGWSARQTIESGLRKMIKQEITNLNN